MSDLVNLLEVKDSTVLGMMGNPEFLNLIPCLKTAAVVGAQAKQGCGRCPRKQNAAQKQTAAAGLRCLANLRGDKLAEVKRLLGAKQLRILATNGAGVRVKYTL